MLGTYLQLCPEVLTGVFTHKTPSAKADLRVDVIIYSYLFKLIWDLCLLPYQEQI